MSHAQYEVVWHDRINKWEVYDRLYDGNYALIDRFEKKAPAKKFAKKMAKQELVTYAAYSKDANNPRVTEQKDYTDY